MALALNWEWDLDNLQQAGAVAEAEAVAASCESIIWFANKRCFLAKPWPTKPKAISEMTTFIIRYQIAERERE